MVISRDTYDPAKNYRRIRFHEDRQLLDSELNELQDTHNAKLRRIADQFLQQGAIVDGCSVAIGGTANNILTIQPGSIYIDGHIESAPSAVLDYDPAKLIGNDLVYAELIKSNIGAGQDGTLINTRTLEPTAEREQWSLTLKKADTTPDPLPTGATARIVVPVMIFDRAARTVRPCVPRLSLTLDLLADAQIDSAQDGQILRFDGETEQWRNTGLPALDELADVAASAPSNNQLLRYDAASHAWVNSNESTNADTVDGIHASTTAAANKLMPLNANAKIAASLIEGSVAQSTAADTVDGFHANATATANTILPLNPSAKIPGTVISGQVPDSAHAVDSDKVDGFHASATPGPNIILPLDVSGTLNLGSSVPIRNASRFQIGSGNLEVFNRIGGNTSGHGLSSGSDLLISGALEVDGQSYFDNHVSAAGNLSVAGNLSGYRCLLTCGHIDVNYLYNWSEYRNLRTPFGLFMDTFHGLYMPRAGSVTGVVGRFDQISLQEDSNLKMEVVTFPTWAIVPFDLPQIVDFNVPIGPVTWPRGTIPFGPGDIVWLRFHQASQGAESEACIQNVEVMVEVTFD